MKCKNCDKEFESCTIEHNKDFVIIGQKYGSSSYTAKYKCPHCGFDNTPVTILQK